MIKDHTTTLPPLDQNRVTDTYTRFRYGHALIVLLPFYKHSPDGYVERLEIPVSERNESS